jgi:hypothetical protein
MPKKQIPMIKCSVCLFLVNGTNIFLFLMLMFWQKLLKQKRFNPVN